MNIYQKFAILLVSCIFLIWLLWKPLSSFDISRKYFDMPEDTHEITQVELNDFLYVWSNMMQSVYKDSIISASFKTDSSNLRSFKKWLELQHWSVERFFYTEQKIRELLSYAEIKKRLEDNKKIAKVSHTNLRSINRDLQKRLDSVQYSDKELDLIILNSYQITEVLSGRAILGKK